MALCGLIPDTQNNKMALSGWIYDTQNRKIGNSKTTVFKCAQPKTNSVDIKTLQRLQMKDDEIVTVISETN